MNEEPIAELERDLGVGLPADYRSFLLTHQVTLLERALVFDPPRSGTIDELFTIQVMVENDRNGRIGVPERSLMHIGGNLMGGHLYLKVSDKGFGEIHYSENYEMRERFASFSEFLAETTEEGSEPE